MVWRIREQNIKKKLDDSTPKRIIWYNIKKTVDKLSMTQLEGDEQNFVYIQPISLLEGDEEEVKEGKRSILTLTKLLTKLHFQY